MVICMDCILIYREHKIITSSGRLPTVFKICIYHVNNVKYSHGEKNQKMDFQLKEHGETPCYLWLFNKNKL